MEYIVVLNHLLARVVKLSHCPVQRPPTPNMTTFFGFSVKISLPGNLSSQIWLGIFCGGFWLPCWCYATMWLSVKHKSTFSHTDTYLPHFILKASLCEKAVTCRNVCDWLLLTRFHFDTSHKDFEDHSNVELPHLTLNINLEFVWHPSLR